MDGMCQTPAFQHYKEFVEHGKWIVWVCEWVGVSGC
jgi:hypothetical protein